MNNMINNEVNAAIAMALYEMQGAMLHDEESGKITIQLRKTPWSVPQQIILR